MRMIAVVAVVACAGCSQGGVPVVIVPASQIQENRTEKLQRYKLASDVLDREQAKLQSFEEQYSRHCKGIRESLFHDSLPKDLATAWFLFHTPEGKKLLEMGTDETMRDDEQKEREAFRRLVAFNKELDDPTSKASRAYQDKIDPRYNKMTSDVIEQRERVKRLTDERDAAEAALKTSS